MRDCDLTGFENLSGLIRGLIYNEFPFYESLDAPKSRDCKFLNTDKSVPMYRCNCMAVLEPR